jgi:hypothetical protein
MPRKIKNDTNDLVPWYKVMPRSMIPRVDNPAYKNHLVELPARILIVGASGSGKSQAILSTIHKMPDTFHKIVLVTQNSSEPLYQFLKSKLKPEDLIVCEGMKDMPGIKDLDHDYPNHTLIICDDMVLEKKQDKFEELFMRGRKVPATVIYATQSFHATPIFIRKNLTHCWLKKLATMRDLRLVLKDYDLDATPEEMMEMYKYCTEDGGFLNLAVVDKDPHSWYRKNYTEFLHPDYKNEKEEDKS